MTETTESLERTRELCVPLLKGPSVGLSKDSHSRFLWSNMGPLPGAFLSLDASKPWLVFWTTNALALLGSDIVPLRENILITIDSCQSPMGGYGGGFGQDPHLLATYAAICSLVIAGKQAWQTINRSQLKLWLFSLKNKNGSFRVCRHGEVDLRACYCALVVASLTKILDNELKQGIVQYISRCQTEDGGFGPQPDTEAHGGYTFCALAALHLLGGDAFEHVNLERLATWLIHRQEPDIGGLSGRTNKLVDSCYGHWVGGCWSLLRPLLGKTEDTANLWDPQRLENYILKCCQAPSGLRDKPDAPPDAYHTNYALCGIAACEYAYEGEALFTWEALKTVEQPQVSPLNPVLGIPLHTANECRNWLEEGISDF